MAATFYAFESLLFRHVFIHLLPTPIYSALTFSALAWLAGNHAANARSLYIAAVRPALLKSEHSIDIALQTAIHHIDLFTQHAIIHTNSFVAPYAEKLDRIATKTSRKIQHSHTRPSRLRYRTTSTQ